MARKESVRQSIMQRELRVSSRHPRTRQCQGHRSRRGTVCQRSEGLLSLSIRHTGRVGFYFIVPRQLVHSKPSASASPQMGQAPMTEQRHPVHQRIRISPDEPLRRECQGIHLVHVGSVSRGLALKPVGGSRTCLPYSSHIWL